jgi:hypothetical protein
MRDWQITYEYHKIACNYWTIIENKYNKFRNKESIPEYEQHKSMREYGLAFFI